VGLNTGARGLVSGATNWLGEAFSGLSGSVAPFAEGGIVSSPTLFGMGSSFGLMGRARRRRDPAAVARTERAAWHRRAKLAGANVRDGQHSCRLGSAGATAATILPVLPAHR
jgi:hypothetical protein